MLGISLGAPELLIVLVIVLLLFGAPRLPKLARSLGEASKEFRRGTAEDLDEEPPAEPARKPPGKRSGTSN
ncbi:MAG TPA: twin-arginine translocase TatA/TatE family subunit [bacterium]|nr:twin-arginine translocase TatA/TatE family subunit [bacterium]